MAEGGNRNWKEGRISADLSEVKAILHRLQRFDFHTEDEHSTPLAHEQTPIHAGKAAIQALHRRHDASAASQTGKSRKVRYVLYVCIAAICGYGGLSFFLHGAPSGSPTENASAGAKTHENAEAKLSEARRSLSEGNVTQARQLLMQIEPQHSADAAFVLAQSYDPNYLQTLPKANDAPNKLEAERWYKAWYALALQKGLKMDSERLQRVINAMH